MRADIVPGAVLPDYELSDVEPDLRVYKIYNGYWFFGRPTVETLRLDLRAVLQRCRPDWDINSAEQRAGWAKGDTDQE